MGCLGTCGAGDVKCASACRARFPAYGAEAAALQSCEAAHCTSACQVVCGGYVYADPACGACGTSQASCCDLSTACVANPECARLTSCERACAAGDAECLLRCELAHPDGKDAERAFGDCLTKACPTTCIQPQWACLQRAPAPASTTVIALNITLQFYDYESGKPLAGLTARPCNTQDLTCATPVGEATVTNAGGVARMHLPFGRFAGYTEVSGPDIPTVLVYFPPLTRDFVAGSLPIPRQSTFQTFATSIATPRADAASLIVTLRDCLGLPHAGVKLSIQPTNDSTTFYFVGTIPSKTAMATDADSFGAGGFVNTPASTAVNVHATVAENGLSFPPLEVVMRPGPTNLTLAVLSARPP
jgi:hypothetical protein